MTTPNSETNEAIWHLAARPGIMVTSADVKIVSLFRETFHAPEVVLSFLQDQERSLGLLTERKDIKWIVAVDAPACRRLGRGWFERAREIDRCLPILWMSEDGGSVETPLAGLGLSYVMKSTAARQLPTIVRALSLERMSREDGSSRAPGGFYVAASAWARQMAPFLDAVAGADVPVLIQGETGTGKEMLARQLHAGSPRMAKPFLKLNCAALPSELIESELFGYERGAFTGAFKSNPGKFELAEGGVLLLDEIGDMDVRLQAKLLQVLQDQQFYRLGAKESSKVHVRVMAATHTDLETAIVEKRFREDLFYRLNVASIHIPPLRERMEEVIPLAEHFLWKHSPATGTPPPLSPKLREALLTHEWPGNVRELENLMRRYIVMPDENLAIDGLRASAERRQRASATVALAPLDLTSMSADLRRLARASEAADTPKAAAKADPSQSPTMAQIDAYKKATEADAILAALESARWNRKKAAEILKVDYKVFLYRMKRLGIGQDDK